MAHRVGGYPRSAAVSASRPPSPAPPPSTPPIDTSLPSAPAIRTPGPAGPAAPRIVLDTNVCLDLLLFEDPRINVLAEALQAGNVVAVVDADCRAEWLRVLGYPALRLEDTHRAALVEAFDALMHLLPADAPRLSGKPPPRCVDPDDQKFLHLAHATGARWLLSRDQHLLVLAARCRRDGLFEILTPQDWAARFADAASA